MSERPIAVGDLVQVVRGHSCALGFTFKVSHFCHQIGGGWMCPRCNTRDLAPEELIAANWRAGLGGFPVGWLKRIPPLDELERFSEDEPLRLPKKVAA